MLGLGPAELTIHVPCSLKLEADMRGQFVQKAWGISVERGFLLLDDLENPQL